MPKGLRLSGAQTCPPEGSAPAKKTMEIPSQWTGIFPLVPLPQARSRPLGEPGRCGLRWQGGCFAMGGHYGGPAVGARNTCAICRGAGRGAWPMARVAPRDKLRPKRGEKNRLRRAKIRYSGICVEGVWDTAKNRQRRAKMRRGGWPGRAKAWGACEKKASALWAAASAPLPLCGTFFLRIAGAGLQGCPAARSRGNIRPNGRREVVDAALQRALEALYLASLAQLPARGIWPFSWKAAGACPKAARHGPSSGTAKSKKACCQGLSAAL